jgi:DNA-binding beta-propeller fold protein YncE
MSKSRILVLFALAGVFIAANAAVCRAGQIYWSDSAAAKIWRAEADGGNAQVVVTLAAGSEPRGIALDAQRGMLYWNENGTNRIRRAKLDGSDVESIVTTGLSFPADIEVDAAAGKIYWADRDLDVIRRANLDGSNVETILSMPAAGTDAAPYFLELDVPSGQLYWGEFDGGTIHRARLDGALQENVVTGLDHVRDIAVHAGKIYWNERNLAVVQRQNLDGSDRETLFGPTGLVHPHGLALDPANDQLYFADTDGQTIYRGGLAGGAWDAVAMAQLQNPWDVEVLEVPEPASIALLAITIALVAWRRR